MNDNIQVPISSILTNYEREFVQTLDNIKLLTSLLHNYPNRKCLNPAARESKLSVEAYWNKFGSSRTHEAVLKERLYNGHKPFKDKDLSEIINIEFLKWLKYQLMFDIHIVTRNRIEYPLKRHIGHPYRCQVVKDHILDDEGYIRGDCYTCARFNYSLALCMIEKKLSDLGLTISDIDIFNVSTAIITIDSNGISIPKERFYYKTEHVSFERSHIWEGYAITVPFKDKMRESIVVPIVYVTYRDLEGRFEPFVENMKGGIFHYIGKYQKYGSIT